MKSKVLNRIPGKKAQETILEKKPRNPLEEIEKAGESPSKAVNPDDRELLEDKKRKYEARREFEAAVRSKLKYSRKR
jgi:hypothetical protein